MNKHNPPVGTLHTQVSTPPTCHWATYLAETCWILLFFLPNWIPLLQHGKTSLQSTGADGWTDGRVGSSSKIKKNSSSSRAGRETEREKEGDGVREWESKLTKCDWYSSLPNPHPPWLTQRMNNYLREGKGGGRERGSEREREREREREGGSERERQSTVWASRTTQSTTRVWVRWPLFKPTLQNSRKKQKNLPFCGRRPDFDESPPPLSRLHPLKHTHTHTHTQIYTGVSL